MKMAFKIKANKNWDKIICMWKGSKLSVESFYKEQQIAISIFYKYRKKLKQNNKNAFEPVVINQNDTVFLVVNDVHITCNYHDIATTLEAIK